MAKSLLRTDKEIAEIYERHIKTVYRVCFAYMRNSADIAVNEVLSNSDRPALNRTEHFMADIDNFNEDTIKLYDEKFIPGKRFLMFISKNDDGVIIPGLFASIGDDGSITTISDIFNEYNGYKLNDIRDIVSRINSYRKANEKPAIAPTLTESILRRFQDIFRWIKQYI